MSAFEHRTDLLPFAPGDAPGFAVTHLTQAHWSVRIWGTLGPFWAMSSRILSGTAAAAGIALINSVGNLGGFAGPYLIGLVRSRTNSFAGALIALAFFPLLGAVVTLMANPKRPPQS